MNTVDLPHELNGVRIHFVGIKGTGMAALVEILYARGALITGSDVSERFYTDQILEKLNIKALPFSEKNISEKIQYVIYSSAYNPEKNPDLLAAKKLNIPIMLYSEALGSFSKTAFSAGICGVHGKTTTTGLTGTILKEFDLNSQVLAGSIIASFGNSCTMTSKHIDSDSKKFFVAETCEYQRHFMAFCPKVIVLTSVESDHQDYYPTYEDIRGAFVDYIHKLPVGGTLIYCADDKGAVETKEIALKTRPDINCIPYGLSALGDYKITLGKVENGRQYFSLPAIGDVFIKVPGLHLVRNAAAAVALSITLLKEDKKNQFDYKGKILCGLENFSGGKRRSEITGEKKTKSGQSVIFIDDYGHHPTAIKTTLEGYRKFYKDRKIIVDFMSHTYSRTYALLEEFASSFENADSIIINKIYASAREDSSASPVTGKILAEHAAKYHKDVSYCEEFDEAAQKSLQMLNEPSGSAYPEGYLFVTMGAGDNWKVADKIMEQL